MGVKVCHSKIQKEYMFNLCKQQNGILKFTVCVIHVRPEFWKVLTKYFLQTEKAPLLPLQFGLQ